MEQKFLFGVCDDEPVILKELAEQIRRLLPSFFPAKTQVIEFSSAAALLSYLSEHPLHGLFLDIDMPGISGMDVAEHLLERRDSPLLIFVTNQEALVYQSFRYRPFAFIRKSHFQEEIREVLERILHTFSERESVFLVQNGHEVIPVPVPDLIYFEADGNYLRLRTSSRGEIRFRSTLSAVQDQLKGQNFLRIHKGFLVNLEYADALLGAELRLTEGTRLPVGRTNREQARAEFLRYMRTR